MDKPLSFGPPPVRTPHRSVPASPPSTPRPAAPHPEVAERRAHPRIQMVASVSVTSQTSFFTGMTEDLSDGGVFVATPQPPPIGTDVAVRVSIEGLEMNHIVEHGRVMWHRIGLQGEVSGCGIAFVELDERSRGILAWMMAQVDRQPLFWDL